jgi:polyisoprenoid-binding protein YceI
MRFPLLMAAALLATPALVTTALAAPAPAWSINKAKSRLTFAAAMNGQAINGAFRRFDARIQFDPANLAGSSVVAVIDTGSATTNDPSRDQSLPSADWFNVKAFPQAEFKSSQFKLVGPGRYIAQGNLTIRGVSRPVALPFQLAIKDKLAVMRGSLTIDRRSFGVGQGQFAGTEAVAANVRVDVTIEATR